MKVKRSKGTLKDIYKELCSSENLELAFTKARKGKTLKSYVIKFEEKLDENLVQLQSELLTQTYKPEPLKIFILRDPKTRKISKSEFRDRIVHHAICNIIESTFDKRFIFDSYANRLGKGTSNAIKRFDKFKRKVSQNNTKICFIFKADIKHYFESVNLEILLSILSKRIKDKQVLWLIRIILNNHNSSTRGKGMPLGNLTSQFFANVYLNVLDQFVKHKLRAKYYIRYVDDFVILHTSRKELESYKKKISTFLKEKLDLELHPDKSMILKLHKGVGFLGFRIFFHHKLVRKKNLKKFQRKFETMKIQYGKGLIGREKVVENFEGWIAYASNGNTYKYRKELTSKFNQYFPLEPQIRITNVRKHEKFNNKIETSKLQFTQQKTLYYFKKQLTIKQIAEKRGIKESTVWQHLANLIEYNQLALRRTIPLNKIRKILPNIQEESEKIKNIKNRIKDTTITYDEINCALASIKCKNRKKNICSLIQWYQKTNCFRKCYSNKDKRQECKIKLNYFASCNPKIEMTRDEFLYLFNNHLKICTLQEKEKRRYISWKECQKNWNTAKD